MKGCVFLVGAGPGDPGLLTVRALALLEKADLIVYDTLVNPDHLRHAKKSAVKICVGKDFRHRRFSQEKINRLIIRAARKGQSVVRLKGGDPYLFGRGGEEALFLRGKRIPFQVVPGVTSATACAAYAGIPLTHREHNASVTFLTGHRAHDARLDSVNWKSVAALGGTLVIYMGFYNLEKVTRRLLEAGMPSRTPVCVVEWGTLPWQKSCQGTLADIPRRVRQKKLKAPCIVIIGQVVSLRKKLDWFEKLPLFGKKIVVTRARHFQDPLAEKLSALGAQIFEFPTIRLGKPKTLQAMDAAIQTLPQYDWVVFTSVHGVEAFFERLGRVHQKDARHLATAQVAAVGPQTSVWLERRGIRVDLLPKSFETKSLVEEFKKRYKSLKGQRILLIRSDIAPAELEKAFQNLGARTARVVAYTTRLPKTPDAGLKKRLLKEADLVAFTSASTVRHFVEMLGLKTVKKIAKKARFASIGPVTSKALRQYGLKAACQAKPFTFEGLVKAIEKESV